MTAEVKRAYPNRTVRVGDTTILILDLRAFRLVTYGRGAEGPHTEVWIRDLSHPFVIEGDHVETLTKASEGLL